MSFLVSFRVPDFNLNGGLDRRQTSSITNVTAGFIDSTGEATGNCYRSVIYQLSDRGTLGSGSALFSTSGQEEFQPFVASTTIQKDSTLWEILGDTLVWNNVDFLNGTATFCLQSQEIFAYFKTPPPSSCTPLLFTQAPCQYIVYSGVDTSLTSNSIPMSWTR